MAVMTQLEQHREQMSIHPLAITQAEAFPLEAVPPRSPLRLRHCQTVALIVTSQVPISHSQMDISNGKMASQIQAMEVPLSIGDVMAQQMANQHSIQQAAIQAPKRIICAGKAFHQSAMERFFYSHNTTRKSTFM
jgi:hypothetical protein